MAIELSIVQQRGTIFISKFLGYSPEIAAKYGDLLTGAKAIPVPVPSPFGIPMQPEALQPGGTWQLVRGGVRVVFSPNRVDVFKDWISPRHVNEEKEFVSMCSDIFERILIRENVTASRVAYSPAFARDKDITFSDGIVWSCLLKKTSFAGLEPLEVSVIRNYRVTKVFKDKEYLFNFRTSFGSANHSLPDGTVATGSVLVNFDINSIPDKDYAFTPEVLKWFFESSLDYSDALYDNFLNN